ncbi:MAG TPA: hypothetical protein VEY89_00140, partial [Candidatus Dormibacteraeota bacterium]|nr:hypothetical protein [Candidatus Dormibacteraeota bacterium]
AAALLTVRAAADAGGVPGLHEQVAFSAYAPLAASAELVRRLLSPLAAAEVQRRVARTGQTLIEQSVDITQESFSVYVPRSAPPGGYALLVFVPPWQDARLPRGWGPVLDEYGMLFVSAVRTGNDADVIGRREPLALHAAYNLMQRYRVDPQHVYVGGFSGGSRIALRLALGYPDLFRGALLNAGSDPLGADPPTPPPRELFARFQEGSRLVYVSGERDLSPLATDGSSLASMRRACVFEVDGETTPGAGHEVASPAALARALRALLTPPAPDAQRLAACRSGLDHEVEGRLAHVRTLLDAGRREAAQKELTEVDRRFGGLAAPGSLELQGQLGTP